MLGVRLPKPEVVPTQSCLQEPGRPYESSRFLDAATDETMCGALGLSCVAKKLTFQPIELIR